MSSNKQLESDVCSTAALAVTVTPYHVSSHAYLDRASAQLKIGASASLFYAAFELRCGIEARMREYLVAWDHISKSKKNGWRIAELHQNIEEEFRLGNKVIRLAIHDRESDALIMSFYYTPVTSDLKKDAEMIGNDLHAQKRFREPDDAWWVSCKSKLDDIAMRLKIATTGTLLGPPLMKLDSGQVDLKLEFPQAVNLEELRMKLNIGSEAKFQVSFLDVLPSQIEQEAVTW